MTRDPHHAGSMTWDPHDTGSPSHGRGARVRASRRHHAHRWAKAVATTATAALTLTLLQGTPALGADDDAREQRRPKTQDVVSTPVVEADGEATPLKHLTGYGTSPSPK